MNVTAAPFSSVNFSPGSAMGGLAGCLYSFLNGYISPEDCLPIETFVLWAMVVVGGRGSNNTLQLVRTCAAAGRRVIHIERPEELRTQMFCGAQIVGVTAGTSTLPETVAAVLEWLEEISRVAPNETSNQRLTS